MARWSVFVLTAMLGALLAAPAAAQWKWRGQGGQIQYSDLPPPLGVAERDILQRPEATQRKPVAPPAAASAASAAASGVALLTPKQVEPELEAKRRQAEQQEAAKKKAEEERVAAAKAENCTRAKGQLKALEDGIRMARTNAKGELERLDDKGRAEEIKRTREIMASDCAK
jgi:hypothetical protein